VQRMAWTGSREGPLHPPFAEAVEDRAAEDEEKQCGGDDERTEAEAHECKHSSQRPSPSGMCRLELEVGAVAVDPPRSPGSRHPDSSSVRPAGLFHRGRSCFCCNERPAAPRVSAWFAGCHVWAGEGEPGVIEAMVKQAVTR
jgi:hypothetical protein